MFLYFSLFKQLTEEEKGGLLCLTLPTLPINYDRERGMTFDLGLLTRK